MEKNAVTAENQWNISKDWLPSKPPAAAKLQLYRDGWFFHFAIDVYCATMMRKRPPFLETKAVVGY